MKLRSPFLAVLGLFGVMLATQPASAAITFNGRVLDCNGQGVAGVHVTVALRQGATCGQDNNNNSILACTTTDASGYWSHTQTDPLASGWAGNWCFNTYGNSYNGYCSNNLPCCNSMACTGGGTSITTSNTNGLAYNNLNFTLNYAGACGGGDGEGDPDPKLPHP